MSRAIQTDAKFARDAWIRALQKTASIAEAGIVLPTFMQMQGQRLGAAPALACPRAAMSYAQFSARCAQVARWGLAQGLQPGEVVALLMNNCSEYPAVWLGLSRIGVVVALVNTQLAGIVLTHSLKIVAPKLIIVGGDLAERVRDIEGQLPPGSSSMQFEAMARQSEAMQDAAITLDERAPPALDATALYIYTSGTTGMPKAARVSHFRLMQWSHWFAGMLDIGVEDRMYNCLPLYHSVGGVVATFATLVGGGAVVIRPRFSASEFWSDVRAERCTLFQYIGELCRYLVNSPAQPAEDAHGLRLACGNGLRPEVWQPFKERFRIPRILEYYASTEGNFSLYNCEGRPGAIGRIPAFLAARLPVALARFDVESGQLVRNAHGLCERCGVDEAGEALGLVPPGDASQAGRFEGYLDSAATSAKLVHDVFEPGDTWYRTGDLMRRDEAGFYYFVDRIGDTFRWKGENVSSAEVLSVISDIPGVVDAVVYGVALPGADGRAGAAALVVDERFDVAAFRAEAARRLPGYARPAFIRILRNIEATGTFKPRKQDLMRAGVDPSLIADPLYFENARAQRYEQLGAAEYREICEGLLRL